MDIWISYSPPTTWNLNLLDDDEEHFYVEKKYARKMDVYVAIEFLSLRYWRIR